MPSEEGMAHSVCSPSEKFLLGRDERSIDDFTRSFVGGERRD